MSRTDCSMSRIARNLVVFLSLVCLPTAVLAGCAGSIKVSGFVIGGQVGQAVVVDAEDERLSDEGIPGVEVALLAGTTARGGPLIAKSVSDESGAFEFVLERGQYPTDRVVVRTTGDAIFSSRSRAFLPKEGQTLLCSVMLRPTEESLEDR